MPLFYSPRLEKDSQNIFISGDEYKHITKSRRKSVGDKIHLTNGKGILATGNITLIDENSLKIEILNSEEKTKTKPRIALAFSLLKKNNKLIVKKTTELGITEFFPFISKRTVKKNYSEKLRSKLERVTIAAMKQSGSAFLPPVNPIINYSELLPDLSPIYKPILAWEETKSKFISSALAETQKNICLIVGPEGGFSDNEIDYGKKHGADIVSLGNHILRAETAAIATSTYTIFHQISKNSNYY